MIRRATHADWGELSRLFAEIYRANPRMVEKDFVDWAYGRLSLGEPEAYNLWISNRDGAIGAFMAEIPLAAIHDGREVTGAWPGLWWGAAREDALAVYFQVMKSFHPRLYLGLTPVAAEVTRSLGMAFLERLPRWVGILDPVPVSAFSTDGAAWAAQYAASCAALGALPADDPDIRECAEFGADFEASPSAFHPEVQSFVRRTGPFLNWRYMRMPRHNYRAFVDGRSGGLAVCRTETVSGQSYAVTRVVEWLVRRDRAAAMLGRLAAEAKEAGAVLMDFFCSSRIVGHVLEGLGMLDEDAVGRSVPAYFRPLWNPPHGLALAIDFLPLRRPKRVDFDTWYISRGDSDVDRVKL